MARRTKAEALETRERILDVAAEVFYERGVARASLAEIAERADVTRGAVYGHFKNKSDVFSAMADRISLPLEAMRDAARDARADQPLAALQEQWVAFLRRTASDPQWQLILSVIIQRCEFIDADGRVAERLRRGRAEGLASMRELLSQAVAVGELPVDLDLGAALHLFHGAVSGILREWLFDPQAYDLGAEAERLIAGLVEALRSGSALHSS